jgi:hypothetical protein
MTGRDGPYVGIGVSAAGGEPTVPPVPRILDVANRATTEESGTVVLVIGARTYNC